MNLKKSTTVAVLLCVIAVGSWELYIRSQGYYPTIDDDKALWAIERNKLDIITKEDVVFLGSSRVLFDIQKNEWETVTGNRPLMLACAGASPLPVFRDIVENTSFNGTIVVGVTPGLFFSTTYPKAEPWAWAQTRVDHFHDRTYAQRLNHFISIPLQKNLALLSLSEAEWSDDVDLKSLLKRFYTGKRTGQMMPPFNKFYDIVQDRNVTMTERTAADTAFANSIKRVWAFYGKSAPPPEKDATMTFFLEDALKFKERGGNLIFLRCPSTGGARIGENHGLPRNEYWDQLLIHSDAKGYHFEDYDELNHFDCPEWSHLSASDARVFTTELAKIMKNDGALTNSKIN